jgi:ankyrin repeat protein
VQQGHFDLIEEHRRLASLSLQYLVLGCFEAKLTDVEMRIFVTQGYYSFVEYALQNWSKHVESCASALNSRDAGLFEGLIEMLETFINQHWIGSNSISSSTSGVSRALQPFKRHRIFEKLSCVMHTASIPSSANQDSDESAVLDLDGILARIRRLIEEIAIENVGVEESTRFRQYYGPNLFKCPKKECEHFHEGFADASSRQNHLRKHERPFFCPNTGCHYADLGCRSLRELNDHTARFHISDGPSISDFPAPDPGKTDPFESISKGNLVALEDFLLSEPTVEGRAKSRANVTRGSKTLLKHAIEKQRVQAVEMLLKHGAKPDETGQGSSVTPLHIACEKGLEPIVRLLIDHGAQLNYSTSRGLVPLHRASSFGHTACVQALVTKGAPISDTDPSGHQSLYLALEKKHFETASALVELGAELLPAVHLLLEDEYKLFRDAAIERLDVAGTFRPVLLREAIDRNLTELASSLLEKGVDPELPHLHLSLSTAIFRGNVALASTLLQKGANPNRPLFRDSTSRYRPITKAIMDNDFEMAKVLLENGALLDDYDLMQARIHLPIAGSSGIDDSHIMIALLLIHGAEVDKLPIPFLQLPTSSSSTFSDSEFRALAAAIGQTMEIRFGDGKTLFHIASNFGYNETLKLMIYSGVNVNTTCDLSRGALHYAVEGGRATTADLLLEHQIDTEIRDFIGLTALWCAFEKDDMRMAVKLLRHGADSIAANRPGQNSLLHLAVRKDNLSAVRMLITEYSNPLSLNHMKWSPLHLAVTLGNAEIIQFLMEETLKLSAPPSFTLFRARDRLERSLLHLAAAHGQHETFDTILAHGLNLEDTDLKGCTALHLAALEGHEDATEALLRLGANINARNCSGQTPLHIAATEDKVNIATKLLRHGADPNIPSSSGMQPLDAAARKSSEEMLVLLKLGGAKSSTVTGEALITARLGPVISHTGPEC